MSGRIQYFMLQPNWLRKLLPMVVACLILAGCNNRPEPIEVATGSPAEIFRAEQHNAETPHGQIDMSTVEDAGDWIVRYRTTSGELFEVEMETAADGTHRWINLRAVPEPE